MAFIIQSKNIIVLVFKPVSGKMQFRVFNYFPKSKLLKK